MQLDADVGDVCTFKQHLDRAQVGAGFQHKRDCSSGESRDRARLALKNANHLAFAVNGQFTRRGLQSCPNPDKAFAETSCSICKGRLSFVLLRFLMCQDDVGSSHSVSSNVLILS